MCHHVAEKVPYATKKMRERVTQIILDNQPSLSHFYMARKRHRNIGKRMLFNECRQNKGVKRELRRAYGSIGMLILTVIINAIIRAIIDRWLGEE